MNLERALKIGDELGGHIVTGHVDGVAAVVERSDEDAFSRFRIEALAASRLDHPNVLRVLDFGCTSEDGLWFLVTEQLAQTAEGGRGHAGVLQCRMRVVVRDGQGFADGRQRAHRAVEEPGEPHGAQRG